MSYDGAEIVHRVDNFQTLAAFVVPESIAYASLAQLPPVTGLAWKRHAAAINRINSYRRLVPNSA
jgi:hypothetical protein